MAKTFKITEEQYRIAMNEGVQLNVTPKAGESASSAFGRTAKEAQDSGMNIGKDGATLKMNPVKSGGTMQVPTTESKVIGRNRMQESKMDELKRNSKLYSISDFMNIITQK